MNILKETVKHTSRRKAPVRSLELRDKFVHIEPKSSTVTVDESMSDPRTSEENGYETLHDPAVSLSQSIMFWSASHSER